MTTFNNQPSQFGMITGKWQAGVGCTDVVGGTLTAGTIDASGSSLFTWTPAFISAPVVIATYNSGILTDTNNVTFCQLTGISTGNGYISIGELDSPYTGATIGILLVGETRL